MTKFEELNTSRTEIIEELKHHISKSLECNEQTNERVVQSRYETLLQCYDEFCKNKKALSFQMQAEEDREKNRLVNFEVTDQFIEAKGILMSLLPVEQSIFNSTNLNNNNTSNERKKSIMKLPPIQIKSFDGSYENWEEFRDIFQACVSNSNSSFSNCEKLLYLKGVLKGEPYELIKNLRSTNQNFEAAWELLEDRYQNKNKIFKAHLNSILDIPKSDKESAADIKKILDVTNASLAAIKALGVVISNADPFIVHILELKLDEKSLKHWIESQKGSTEIDTLVSFDKFLRLRLNILESVEKSAATQQAKKTEVNKVEKTDKKENKLPQMADKKKKGKCTICTEGAQDHAPYECAKFKSLATIDRRKLAQEKKLCKICLYVHPNSACRSKYLCKICKESHNTLLHEEGEGSNGIFNGHINTNKQSPLATAIVSVSNRKGIKYMLRALIDPGSTGSFISEKAVQQLQLEKTKTNMPICSIDNASSVAKSKTNIIIGANHEAEFKMNVNAFVVSKISSLNPSHTMGHIESWHHIHGLQLADPMHMSPGQIDVLLGVDACAEIWESGVKRGDEGMPIAQKTKIGWILFGSIHTSTEVESIKCHSISHSQNQAFNEDIEEKIKNFFESEDVCEEKVWTIEEQEIENKFLTETTIGADGRFIVRLPFKCSAESVNFLGNSYRQAYKYKNATFREKIFKQRRIT